MGCGLQGQWNITAGQNDLFDAFDCQKHYFNVDKQRILHADINWRVQKSDGDFIERHADQTFKQVNLSSQAASLHSSLHHLRFRATHHVSQRRITL